MFKASELVEFATAMLGAPYWYGTCGYKCTEELLQRKAKQYPSHYTSGRMSKYRAAIAAKEVCVDCIGLIKAFFWSDGGAGILAYLNGTGDFKSHYQANGMPDTSANGMLSFCKKNGAANGKIKDLPDVAGVLLFSEGHVGIYVGGGYAIEARGFNYGVVKTRVKDRSWTSWAYIPDDILCYGDDPVKDIIMKRGDKGDEVKLVQELLLKWNCECLPKYGADGDFGGETENAVKNFQRKHPLGVTGKVDADTFEVLAGYGERHIKITGGSVNVRTGAGTDYLKTGLVVHEGDIMRYTETSDVNGTPWYHVPLGWVSGKYAVVCEV